MHNNIFKTHKSINYIHSRPKLNLAVKSWIMQSQSKNFHYYFYDDAMVEQFMRDVVGGIIYEAFQKLPIKVMKTDLWRYCVIYEYGGIYADADTICKINPNIFLTEAFLTIVPEHDNIHLCQWVFSAPPKSPILKEVIDLSVKRILETNPIKGEHIIHYLTGPGAFTDGIERYLKNNNKQTFSRKKEYYNYPDYATLRVFNPNIFHEKMVIHFFAGSDADGWKKERDQKLK